MNQEKIPPAPATRMFQIHEDDLADLERLVPRIMDRMTCSPDAMPVERTWFRRIQSIITNVRWNYGPPEEVEHVPAE